MAIYFPKRGEEFIDSEAYPVHAAEFIIENLDLQEIRLFNEYRIGAYLIYRRIPVFIDSRADLYTEEFNGGVTIFRDYIDVTRGNANIEEVFDYYGITHVLVGVNSRIRMMMNLSSREYRRLFTGGDFVVYERR